MTRFLFTLDDAVDTVLNAVTNAEGGEVFIPQINSYDMNTILKAVEKIHGDKFKHKIIGLNLEKSYTKTCWLRQNYPLPQG